MRKWRVYYTGGATFSDEDGDPFDAPATGVQCVVKEDDQVGRVLLSCQDYYWWDHERWAWYAGDIAGLHQHLMLGKGPKAVLFGQYVSNAEYHEVMVRALADPDFPPKSGRASADGPLP